jgi:hypothetical protein
MAMLGIKVDVDGPLRAFKELRENQIPWTIARALTMTANDCRNAARVEEGRVFQLRNDWTQQRTLTEMATKQNLTAAVYTDTENRRTGAPDYMPMQDEGGTKRPNGYSVQYQGNAYLAVPTKYLRQVVGSGPIPARYRPSQILQFALPGPPSKSQMRTRRKLIRDGVYYFIVRFKSGGLGIMSRSATDPSNSARPLYILITSANLRGRHPVDETVFAMAEEVFPENFSKAAAETIANDLLRGSGVTVRL